MFDHPPQYFLEKFIDPKEIEEKAAAIKSRGTLVTLNGSFDLLHAGHLKILEEAKAQGDFLIVALNTDASIKRYKGKDRPIIPLKFRLQMLSAISFVDYVTYFDEDDPRKILSLIKPSCHVNGIEYGENCIESQTLLEVGAKLHLVHLKPGLSTSNIIGKIKEVCV